LHLLHVLRVGGEEAVAIGSDWDGFVRPCRGLEDVSQLPHLTEALLLRGLSPETIHRLLGGNVLRVLDAVPPLAVAIARDSIVSAQTSLAHAWQYSTRAERSSLLIRP
jgi:membrane dipeptidase